MERILSKRKTIFDTEERRRNERILQRDRCEWRTVECE